MDCTVEPEGAGFLLKLQTDEWEANVHASGEELLRLSDLRSASWDERRSIQAGGSAGARVHWSAGEGEYANLMKEADPSKGYAAAFEKYRNTIKDLMAKAEAAHLDVATVMHISSSLNAVATHAAVLNWSGPTT